MKFLELKAISERDLALVNPTSAQKIVRAGEVAGLAPGARVVDFGCGYGEALALWAERFGVSGGGVDVRPPRASLDAPLRAGH
jgi:cyclopropane fatty-acyl-phospholipid synthase-like methyltransferase